MNKTIDVTGRSREDLLIIAERACAALANIANNATFHEGDRDATEDEFGLRVEEIIEMAHDNMINAARGALDSILRQFPAAKGGQS